MNQGRPISLNIDKSVGINKADKIMTPLRKAFFRSRFL